MNFKKIFLPVGLVLAVIAALIIPQVGVWLKQQGLVPFFVIIIFLASGWHFKLNDAKLNHKFMYSLVIASVISLFLAPFLGVSAVKLFKLGTMTGLGLIVMCCVPVTLSSATVITGLARGNAVWALIMTVIMNLYRFAI